MKLILKNGKSKHTINLHDDISIVSVFTELLDIAKEKGWWKK